MLKALELFGFKSFADKTRFEFPAGITVVVGPNGSGKSNIVDGIKWVLGEQSAKSLRGKEMSDVIFKGSGTSGRKPMNAAEATLILDNSNGHFPIDAPEVHITRRVYRSGEGEYLINRQPARLKDIRDMMRGSGVGTDAYSLIEQGKVDKLLQASAKDRRAIFEEAAGISRFKAKKIEAQRRLERVDQNLLRLSDIVEEVDSRLKSVRNQASKAKRYREYSQRLQELRTQVAQNDWRKLSEKIEALEIQLGQSRGDWSNATGQAELVEASLQEIDAAAFRFADDLRAGEARLSRIREQIINRENTAEQLRSRCRELTEQTSHHGRDLLALSDRAGDAKQRLEETRQELTAADQAHQEIASRLASHEGRQSALTQELEKARREGESRRLEYVGRVQAQAMLSSQVEAVSAQLAQTTESVASQRGQLAEIMATSQQLEQQLAHSRQREQELSTAEMQKLQACEQAQAQLATTRLQHAALSEALSQLHSRQRGMSERAALLAELEKNFEGLGTGVKEILSKAQGSSSGILTAVQGVLADLISVRVEHAGAIDMALGEAAQFIVTTGDMQVVDALAHEAAGLSGRVTFALVEPAVHPAAEPATDGSRFELRGEGVIGPALDLIDIAPEYRPLAARFLQDTWLVETLADALILQQLHASKNLRYVALGGEVVTAGGIVALGPRQSAMNLISRRSELRELRQQIEVLDQQIAETAAGVVQLKSMIEAQDRQGQSLAQEAQEARDRSADQRGTSRTLEERVTQSKARLQTVQLAWKAAQQTEQQLSQQLQIHQADLVQAAQRVAAMEETIQAEQRRLSEIDQLQGVVSSAATLEKVELAKSEQRLETLRLRSMQFEDDQRERQRTLAQVREQLRQAASRYEAAEIEILAASSELADLYLQKEACSTGTSELIRGRDSASSQRTSLTQQAQSLRQQIRKLDDQKHQLELSAGEIRHQRTTLIERLREDYGIDLASLTTKPTAEQQEERAAIEEEIEALRRKINQIGAVNLDALDELDELEARFGTLSGQFKDLTDAKLALEKIIQKVNGDSRRLFLETLDAIRINFQALYRKAFGGGTADIVLEEGVDVLECGVEIVATPPGKPSFNNSLLSGGEKALTAVALLLAIFQFRPSPFCVLDEVDAPFDEANIGRFVDVLKEFLGWTKFVVVTHSKKTMTAATTLYGVTMQESGISKRVSVRFDDVSDDGHIRREALDREAA